MKALYVLGTGSQYDNLELKYSLRSLERYGAGIDGVVIIGEKPKFLDYSKVVHYPFRETGPKDFIIASKIMYACSTKAVTGDFLFLNDDFFFTSPFHAPCYPYFQKGPLLVGDPIANRPYTQLLAKTRDFLISKGKTTSHFDVHTPIVYNAEKFMALKDCWEASRKSQIGMVVKSMYCNMYGLTGPFYNDVKPKTWTNDDMHRALGVNCFSCYDDAIPAGLGAWLENKFPKKSKYEI